MLLTRENARGTLSARARLEKREGGGKALSSPREAIYERKGKSRLTPGSTGGVDSRENYVSGGTKIGYVMELAED